MFVVGLGNRLCSRMYGDLRLRGRVQRGPWARVFSSSSGLATLANSCSCSWLGMFVEVDRYHSTVLAEPEH